MTIKEDWKRFDLRAGHTKHEIKIPVSRIIDFLTAAPKPKTATQWVYECGCPAPEMYRSKPYCPIHGMRLIRKEK